jgi:hypothetical protein
MAGLQYGDTIDFKNAKPIEINSIVEVMPIKFDAIDEQWVVVAQGDATHMLVIINTNNGIKNLTIEIGECKNIYLLADAIVD